MKKSHFSKEQMMGILKQGEAGVEMADLCREHGISAATFYGWKQKFGGMEVAEAQRLKARLIAAAILLLFVPQFSFARTLKVAMNAACGASGGSVSEAGYIQIGGIRQWVVVDGQDCANPIVLMVHGGPGNPNTPFAGNIFGGWAKDFTVVQWDQRGSGKTYAASPPAEGEKLSMERMVQDGLEVARYAAQRLHKRKVILMGGSWGSALAVNMAMTAPNLFYGYVGTSQLVNYQDDIAASYAHTLKLARAANDSDAIGKLSKIGAPPWTDPHHFGILRRITRKYEAMSTDPAPPGWYKFGPDYDTPAYHEAYDAGEDYSFLQFVGLAGDGMGPKVNLRRLGTRFPIPVYLIQGEEDLLTPAEISRAYFDSLSAPKKDFLLLPRTGHDPNSRMIETLYQILKDRLRDEALAKDRH